jgi:predicted ATP-grasp superfamily ATP-dependent carboligase
LSGLKREGTRQHKLKLQPAAMGASTMKKPYPIVLLLGVVPSLTWLVARCLRRAGGAPVVLGWHALAPMMLSGDCRNYIEWSQLKKSDEKLDHSALAQVRALCAAHAIEYVMAADFDAALLLAECADSSGIACFSVPRADTIITLNNKWTLSRLLLGENMPIPESEYIPDAEALMATSLDFPIITKPLDKWASVGFQVHGSRKQLAATINKNALKSSYPLIAQRYVPGWDVGASFLANHGHLVAFSLFRHQRRGERTFFGSQRVRQLLEQFVVITGYNGVGHLDLRYDPARDDYRILELNPRFWASLLYATNAGLNYPHLLAHLAQWDGHTVHTARSCTVRLDWYERAMTLSHRWFGNGYEKFTGANL